MAKIILPNITSGYYSTTALNDAFADIEVAFENTLSRDGTVPNQMEASLDMNSNRITNLPEPINLNEAARLQDVINASNGDLVANLIAATPTTNNAGTTVQEHLNNLGEATGAASVGNTPAGSIAATTVQAAINELDSEKQPLDATLTALAGTLTAANKIPYATALDTAGELDFKDEDNMASDSATAVPSQQSTKAYADTKNIVTQVAPTTAGNVIHTTDGTTWTSTPKITSGTAVATTSGTAHDFTGIPSWVKRITVMLVGVSTNGASPVILQLGDSGGIETSGYVGGSANIYGTNLAQVGGYSTGFTTIASGAALVRSGTFTLSLANALTNTWTMSSVIGESSSGGAINGGGYKALTDVLDRVRLTTVNGTDLFDAGSVNILYE